MEPSYVTSKARIGSAAGPVDAMDQLAPDPRRALPIVSIAISSTTKYERNQNYVKKIPP